MFILHLSCIVQSRLCRWTICSTLVVFILRFEFILPAFMSNLIENRTVGVGCHPSRITRNGFTPRPTRWKVRPINYSLHI